MPETRYRDLSPRVWCRSPRIDFYRDSTAAVANRRAPRCCATNYLLLARNRPAGNLFIHCPCTQGVRPKYSLVSKGLLGSSLRILSDFSMLQRFDAGEAARPRIDSRCLSDFELDGFYRLICLVLCSASQRSTEPTLPGFYLNQPLKSRVKHSDDIKFAGKCKNIMSVSHWRLRLRLRLYVLLTC